MKRSITARKKAEATLHESQERLANIVDLVSEAIISTDEQARIVLFNKAAELSFGYRSDEVLGQPLTMLLPRRFSEIHSRHVHAFGTMADQAHPMGSSRLVIGRRKDGTEFSLQAGISKTHNSGPTTFTFIGIDVTGRQQAEQLAVIENVTERQRAEEALRRSEADYRALADNSVQGIVIYQDQKAIYANPAATRIFGYTVEEFRCMSVEQLIALTHPIDRPISAERARKRMAGEALAPSVGVQILRKDGSIGWVEAFNNPIEYLGRPAVLSTMIDITKRMQTDEALSQERNLLRTLIDNLPDAVYFKDRQSRFVIKNLADARKMGAATPDETVGKSDFDYYPPELAAEYFADDQAVIQSGQAILNREEPITEATGRTGWVSTTKVPLRDREGNVVGLVGIGHDITERKRAEEEIKHRLAELEAVNRVSTAMRAARTLDQLLNEWLDVTLAITHASGGSLWLYDRARDELQPKVGRGWDEPPGAGPVQPLRHSEGINGHVFVTGQPYTSSNFREDPRSAAAIRERFPPGGGVCLPIRAEDQVIGTFVLYLPEPRPATPDEVQLITTLSEMVGTAIHRTVLHEQTERRLQNLVALREVDQAINSSVDLQVSLSTLLGHLIVQLGVDAADVLVYNPGLLLLNTSAGQGFRTEAFNHTQLRLGVGYAGRAALERSLVHVPNLAALSDNPRLARAAAAEGFVCYFAVPLIAKGVVKGVLEAFRRTPLEVDVEWLDLLHTLAGQAAIAIENDALFNGLQRSNTELTLAYDATIEGWSHALDLRDEETEGHTRRVAEATVRLALVLGLRGDELAQVRWGGLLHDIGKMGVPDSILLKPGPLTQAEWVVMKKHPTFAYEMLAPIHYLRSALDIPYCHHEKWDGTGYPRGLKGVEIPLSARIFAVVDVWDALLSDRPYRAAWPSDRVREYIRSQAGTHFDPDIVNVALESDVLVRHERD